MEIAFDITERELQKQELKNMLDVQTLITNCVRMLYAVDDLDQTINAVLTQIGEFLVSDRAYVFEIKDELMNNTHEWTARDLAAAGEAAAARSVIDFRLAAVFEKTTVSSSTMSNSCKD